MDGKVKGMTACRVPEGDTISRQAAIDALNEYFARIGKLKRRGLTKGEKAISLDTVGVIKTLPSAQPEDCDTCKHGYFGDNHCETCRVRYPSHYERRTDGN